MNNCILQHAALDVSADTGPTVVVILSIMIYLHGEPIVHSWPLTELNVLPQIPPPAHECQTLITVLQQINYMVMGHNRKTVIAQDRWDEMSRDDCNGKWILKLGEMPVVMAAFESSWQCHWRQWIWGNLAWHIWTRHHKSNPWSQAYDESPWSTYD